MLLTSARFARFLGSLSLGNGYGPPNAIWTPDIYFANEVNPMYLDEVIKLQPYIGAVFWSRHVVVELSNVFNLEAYPFDSQNLSIQITSYSYNDEQLELDWAIDGATFPEVNDSVFTQQTWELTGTSTSKMLYVQHARGVPYDMLVLNI